MRIYVAGKYGPETNKRVNEVQAALVKAGHKITYDWTRDESADGGGTPSQAMKDMNGVLTADVFVLVAERMDVVYCGAIAEFGMALATGVPIYILGRALHERREGVQGPCIFTKIPAIMDEKAYERDLIQNGIDPANERDHSDDEADGA